MKITIRNSIFETNSSSSHAFMYMSKETFEKWRRGEVRIKGGGYPVRDLTDNDFETTKRKPDTVYGHQTDKYPKEEWLRKRLDAIDNPEVKADLLYVIRKYFAGKDFHAENSDETFDGSYVSMLLIYMRHGSETVLREQADKRYVDPEEWGAASYEEALAAFRKALCEIKEWKDINNEKYVKFRKAVNDLREKDEIAEASLSAIWKALYEMDAYKIKDKKFNAFETAFYELYHYDTVFQNPFLDVRDNGKNVRIHIWGRDDG